MHNLDHKNLKFKHLINDITIDFHPMEDKISFKIGLEKNFLNSYIFVLDANFENLTIELA